ncbi:hypothetical protein FNV43_RR15317 [Rhamnella rubrinervis]|uniref:B3 domain-containing protein n=1 Tax=Rhamnella rubrinervis TaxID=2594499 RepID=A0A8K0GXC9_9ROSA|nr:hypothetical protein FNV43_RR15317 [Rhamnella rubrinervis]
MRLLTEKDFEGFDFKNVNCAWDVLLDVSGVALDNFEQEIARQPLLVSEKKRNIIAAATSSSNFIKRRNKALLKPTQRNKALLKPTQEEKQKQVLVINNKDIAKHSRRHCDYDIGVDKFLMMNNINYSTTSTRKRSRNTISLGDQEDGRGDPDWEQVMNIKKQKKKNAKPTAGGNKKRRRMKFVRPDPDECPDLPDRFKQRIDELNGRDITLVIQKPLFGTDLSHGHDRLSIPFAQILTWDNFLKPDEMKSLSAKETKKVPIIDPKLDHTTLVLTQWNMKKKTGKTSFLYVLRSKWYKVAEDNDLQEGQVLQVWSFRVEGRLHIALVVLSNKAKALATDDDLPPLGFLPSSSGAAGGSSSNAGGCGSSH